MEKERVSNDTTNTTLNSKHQGAPMLPENPKGGCLMYCMLILLVIVLIAIFAKACSSSPNKSSASASYDADTAYVDSTMSEASDTVVSQKKEEKTWDYDTQIDEMNDSKSKFASLVSDNSVDFDFPYQGGSYLTITVRYTKKWGTDVYIRISQGQFVCNEYEGTDYVRVRFDNGKPMRFSTNEPSDGSSDMLFLNNAKKFISLAKKAKRIRIEAPFYQAGNQVFSFTVDKSLEW